MSLLADHEAGTLLDRARWLYRERADARALTLITSQAEDRSVTYGEFLTEAARYGFALEQVGVQPGDLVILVLQHGEAVLYSFWGAMLLGAVPSIFPFLTEKLDPEHYFDSVGKLVAHSGAKVVITYDELEPALRGVLSGGETPPAILTIEQLQPGGDVAAYLERNPAGPDDIAFLQHSSGSTGLQKGVMLSHRSVLNQVTTYSAAIALQPEDVVVSWLPLYHDMGLIAGFIQPIMQGVPLVLMSPFHWIREPGILLHAIQRYRGTLCWLPNFAYNFLATRVRPGDLDGLDLSSWRAVINCSEPVYAESHRVFVERFVAHGLRPEALATCYAMAENTFAVTQSVFGQPLTNDLVERKTLMEDKKAIPAVDGAAALSFVSCGKPIDGCEIRIVDEQRHDLPERHVGEIALRSNSMLSGYYKRPDATSEVMAEGWYFTGDMGYLAGGELYITGRKKDLIIIGGKNIYPQDVENLINDIPGVHPGRVVAFGVFNDRLGTEDMAVIAEVDTEDANQKAAITREIRARVAQNMDVVCRYAQLVDRMWLLKTSSGKIARRANREKFLQDVLNQESTRADASETR